MDVTGHVFFRAVENDPTLIMSSGVGSSKFDTNDVVAKILPLANVNLATKTVVVNEELKSKCHVIAKETLTAADGNACSWERTE